MPPVSVRITTATRKPLEATLRQAFEAGDRPLVKRVTALLGIARGEPVDAGAAGVGVGPSTVYAWPRAFLVEGATGHGRLARGVSLATSAGSTLARVAWRSGQLSRLGHPPRSAVTGP
jgi:hypothetical protein